MKTVKRTDLKKLAILISLWFEAQNEEPNDQNKIAACKATVDKCLEKISPSKDERSKIEVAVVFCLCMSTNEEDFEARIRALGYEIEGEKCVGFVKARQKYRLVLIWTLYSEKVCGICLRLGLNKSKKCRL